MGLPQVPREGGQAGQARRPHSRVSLCFAAQVLDPSHSYDVRAVSSYLSWNHGREQHGLSRQGRLLEAVLMVLAAAAHAMSALEGLSLFLVRQEGPADKVPQGLAEETWPKRSRTPLFSCQACAR